MNSNRGSAFVIVIGVLSVIIFASTMFMTSTIEEGRQTTMSVKGLHAASLAEAALERAMSIVSEKINEVDPAEIDADSLSIKLRLPAKADSGVTLGLAGNLGSDELLQLPDSVTEEIILTKEDLQEGDDENRLDKIVEYMTREGIDEYDVNVKVKVEKAFRIAPGSDYPDFKVPGVDIGWNLRPDVEKFLNGEGYSPLEFSFPSGMKWLNFSIPIEIGGIKLVDINVGGIISRIMPTIEISGEERTFNDLTTFDFFAEVLINDLLSGGKERYPIEINFNEIPIPTDVTSLWPSGVSIDTSDPEQYLEKYGQIKLESEASITYKDGYTAKRRVAAVKDFKVADCEPVAPMYSFFVGNFANDKISFNNYGGTFIVKNYDYGGVWSKIKEIAMPGPTELTEEELEKREVPGLVRVNYLDQSSDGTEPLVCNVGIIGDWGAPNVTGDDSGILTKTLSGIEAFLILSTKSRMALAGGSYNINAEVTRRNTSSSAQVPSSMTGGGSGGVSNTDMSAGSIKNNYGLSFTNTVGTTVTSPLSYIQNTLVSADNINLIPDIGDMSTNVIELAIELAVKPLVDDFIPPDVARLAKAFEKWDMPYMGTPNWLYTIPTTGTGANKTHFFGPGALYPTLTREIEGNVLKKYRQWKMCIVGWSPLDRLPLLPFPPVYVPPPPLVIPIWYSQEVLTKYDYNLAPLKANDENGDPDNETYEYDPSMLENMPPNLYTLEQYAKKATYFYENYQAFVDDLENRMTEVNDKKVFLLNGITYISGSMGDAGAPFNPPDCGGEFNVCGKGMIVCSGNMFLGCNIKVLDRSADDLTVFSMIIRNGGLLVLDSGVQREIQGSVYTDKGLYVHANSSMHFIGNWATNQFSKAAMGGTVVVDYVSSRVRNSLASLHPERGKFIPSRYHVSFSPLWSSWRSF